KRDTTYQWQVFTRKRIFTIPNTAYPPSAIHHYKVNDLALSVRHPTYHETPPDRHISYSSKKYVRKFLRALHPKRRAKVTVIEDSKDLTSLSLDELIGNLKVHEMTIKKDSKICLTFGSEDEEYAMAVRDFKKFFKRRECLKPPKDKNQRAFFRGSWSDSGEEDDEKVKHKTCLVAQASNELFSSYEAYNRGNVIFCSNLRGNIIGKGQICDYKCRVIFSEHDSEITKDGKVIGHANMRLIQWLASKELVRNLPKLKFDQHFYDTCKIGKQAHASHKAKNIVSTTKCLELLHIDLFGPSAVQSYGGNRYTLVIVDDYSRYTWTRFLKDKTEAFDQFEIFSKKIQNQLGCTIVSIRTDHGREFDNEVQFGEFCNAYGITHNFSVLRTPQSNGVVERKNRTLQEMSYSQNSKAYIILNKDTRKVKESLNVTFNETPPPSKTSPLVDDDLDEEEAIKVTKKKNLENDIEDETLEIDERVNIRELVAQGHNQQEGIDYDDTYALVARLESIRILLAYACALSFKLFQMDVKGTFLNGCINEEVYVAQPPGFIDFEKPDHVYKLKKALYGLKQAPKAWYDRLKSFLIKHEYKMGMVDNTLFTKKKSSNLIIVQIYVDDIIFGSTCQDICDEFAKIMHDEFEMSIMGELNFFLGLQIKQIEDGIFFKSIYIKEMFKKFGLEYSKPIKTPMSSDTKLTKDKECESVDSTKYRGMIGAIDLSKNPVQHSRTKHIEIHHHFLRDNVQKGHISIEKVPPVDNIADILMKPLKRESFNYHRLGLGMINRVSPLLFLLVSILVRVPFRVVTI
ncbi:retrovirus-related pol polyprotein from transposon TNT 1-94, partial [Tanacetum coccineum]